jgi:hypothetical protein
VIQPTRVEAYRELCHLLPSFETVTVVLIDPHLHDSLDGKEGTATVAMREHAGKKTNAGDSGSGSCTVLVQGYKGVYSRDVERHWPASPDMIVGFDVNLYTCSWRPSLLYLLHVSQSHSTKIAFSFAMARGPVYVLELLAEPTVSFGAENAFF